jgi:hypothetical protein
MNMKKDLMDSAPYLSPWYFTEDRPSLLRNDVKLKWKHIDKINGEPVYVMILEDDQHNCYAILKNTSTYILPSENSKQFLIWKRAPLKDNFIQKLKIFQYESEKLVPIAERDKMIFELKKSETDFYISGSPISQIELDINPNENAQKVKFPESFKEFREFIFITELENIYYNPDPSTYWHNTVFIVFNTVKDWIFIYAQDWFNKSPNDFGYVWITRAVKNPETGLIHGQGIRMGSFVLDETNKKVLSWY